MLIEEATSKYRSFTDLEAWKMARAFKLAVYQRLPRFPEGEKFELTSQLRRAVRSIPAVLSEGHGRFTYKIKATSALLPEAHSARL